MSDNWIVANLENAFSTWNDKMAEIWSLITTSPQNFKGGAIWNVISGINGGLQAIGLGLLVLFFAMSIFKSTASFRDFQRPEYALKHFIRFCAAKVAITYAMDLMTAIYTICGGIVEQIAGSLGGIGAKDKSIIDRCAIKVYGEYLSGKSEYMPTLVDFRNELLRQPEDEAQDLALSLEIFTTGSLDAFAHQSDVNTNKRIVAYDILELGEQMKSIGLLIMLDNIFNRVMANRRRGKYTRVYVDEAHLYFKNPYSADVLLKCWKRFRKYGGLLTGITQNISDCLLNETARGMLSNSEFLPRNSIN